MISLENMIHKLTGTMISQESMIHKQNKQNMVSRDNMIYKLKEEYDIIGEYDL